MCSSATPPKATSFSPEVRSISFPSTTSRSASSPPTPGSPTAPIRLRLGRGRFGSQPLDFFCAARQVGVRGAEVGGVRLCIVVAVCQGRSHRKPAWVEGKRIVLCQFSLPDPSGAIANLQCILKCPCHSPVSTVSQNTRHLVWS